MLYHYKIALESALESAL